MKRLQAAVIGMGFIGVAHVEALRRIPYVDVVAISDRFGVKEKAERLGIPAGYEDYLEMMDQCQLDCVHICTPNNTHMDIVMAALERGINVVCEKPMARNADEAQKMVDAVRESGLVGAVNFHNRYYPIPYQMRRMVQKGELGDVFHVQGGYLQDWLQYDTDFSWKLLSEQCGKTRATADLGSHWIDLAEYVTGQKVTEVFAEFKTVYPQRVQRTKDGAKPVSIDTEDFSCVLLRFDGGAVGTATFSAVFAGKKNQTVLQVAGTKQSLEWNNEQVNDLLIGHKDAPNGLLTKDPSLVDGATASVISYPGGHAEGFPDAFKQNFTAIYGAIRGEKPANPFATFEDGSAYDENLRRIIPQRTHWNVGFHLSKENQHRKEEQRVKIGVVANVLQDKPLKEALKTFRELGIEQVELGCGGYAGKAHVDAERLLSSPAALKEFQETIEDSGVSISALSCHGNPVHPDAAKAEEYHEDMCNTVRLAEKLGIDTITCFSGCPGDSKGSRYPNWVTCAWPDDYLEILKYQWDKVLIPYWNSFVHIAKDCGVNKIALELHPGFCVYNVDTLKRLRDAAGPEIGVNFDPSHLLWQGMDPVAVIRAFEGMIYHVHAKDVQIDRYNTAINGVLDTKHYSDEAHRSWIFRTVGFGNDAKYWKDIFSELRKIGYDGTISIEHEDSLMNRLEGLRRAVEMVKNCAIFEQTSGMWWA